MAILGTQSVTAQIAPTATTDVYPTHSEEYGLGGYQSVADSATRDAITAERRKEGMLCTTLDTGECWQLQSDLTTWALFTTSGGGAPTITLTGDVTGTGTSPIATTLSNSGVVPGTKGTVARSITASVDAKGRVTAFTDNLIQIPEAQVTNLVADLALKEDAANKGAANGYAPLVGGLVPIANLPFIATAYLGLYNAATNTPAILNGVGVAGQFYIANVIGNAYAPVNVTIVNQVVAYDGAVWQVGAVFSSGIAQITTDNGVLTGAAVTMNTTAYLAPTADRQYQTALQKSIQDAAVTAGATAANRYALLSELSSGVVVTADWNTPERYEDGTNSLGTGTISPQFMNTLTNPITGVAYTTASMLAAYPFTPVSWTAATATYADVCVNAAMRGMELAYGSSALHFHDNRIYQYNQGVEMATVSQWSNFFRPDSFVYIGNGSRHYNISGVAKRLWHRIPPNQTEAVSSGNAYTNYKTLMYNMSFYGAGLGTPNSGDVCVEIGATYGSIFQGCTFSSADIGLNLYFCLGAKVIGGNMGFNSRSGIKLSTGAGDGIEAPRWTGATLSNSASNCCSLKPTNITNLGGSFSSIEIYGSNGVSVGGLGDQVVFEGSGLTKPDHHVYFDGQASTLVKAVNMNNFHLEQDVNISHFCIKDYGQVVTAYMGYVSPFLTGLNQAMFEARANPAGSGTVQMVISNCPNLDVGWKLRQIGGGSSGRWTISMCQLYDQTNIYAPLNWDTTTKNGLTGQIPPSPFAQIIAQTP